MLKKGYNFHFCTNVLGGNFFLLCAVSYCAESVFFDTKLWISRRKLNQKRKYFYPIVSGPDQFEWWKKLGVANLVGLSLYEQKSGIWCWEEKKSATSEQVLHWEVEEKKTPCIWTEERNCSLSILNVYLFQLAGSALGHKEDDTSNLGSV